jgi:putative two-component system response regulator
VEQLRDATLHVMISLAEFRDEDTGNHVRRTQEYVRTLARWLADRPCNPMGLDADRIEDIAKSAPLHDIGKVAIPDGILLKPGRLTPDEIDGDEDPRHAGLGDAAPRGRAHGPPG